MGFWGRSVGLVEAEVFEMLQHIFATDKSG